MKINQIIRVFTVLITVSLFVTCSSDDYSDALESSYTFLDLDISNPANFTNDDYRILKEAQARMEKYIIHQNNQCIVTVRSGDEIAISVQLFEALIKAVAITNQKLSDGELFVYNGKLYDTNASLSTRSWDKDEEVEGEKDKPTKPEVIHESGYFGWTKTTTYDQAQAMEYWESFNETNTAFSTVMGVAAFGAVFLDKVSGMTFAGMAFLNHLESSGASTAIYNAAKEGSITVESTMDYITGSLNTTVYNHSGACVSSLTYGSTGLN